MTLKGTFWLAALLAGALALGLTLHRDERGVDREQVESHGKRNRGRGAPRGEASKLAAASPRPSRAAPPRDETVALERALGAVRAGSGRDAQEPSLDASLVEDIVQHRLEELDVVGGAVINVTCEAERCLAEIRGPQLQGNVPKLFADDLTEATGVEHDFASSIFFNVSGSEQVHVAFASFFPAGGSKEAAHEDVKQALEAFQSDMKTDD